MSAIPMVRSAADVWPADAPPGTFHVEPTQMAGRPSVSARLTFVCPLGKVCGVLLGPKSENKRSKDDVNVWAWNGSTDRPSITPSVDCRAVKEDGTPAGGCGWHGFITDGELRT